MNCAEFHEHVAAYVLGALEPGEMAAMHEHLASFVEHEGCRQAFARAQATAAKLGSSLAPVTPSAGVWSNIDRSLGRARPPVTARWREAVAWGLAAAACGGLLIVNDQRKQESRLATKTEEQLLANAAGAANERDFCRTELERLKDSRAALARDAIALLEMPSTRVIALTPLPGKSYRASAIVNLTEGRTIVVASALPRLPGKDFELWVIRGKGAPVAAGFMHTGADGSAVGEIRRDALTGDPPDAFAVSVEPTGGQPTPTEVVMAGALHG